MLNNNKIKNYIGNGENNNELFKYNLNKLTKLTYLKILLNLNIKFHNKIKND